jgi:hypothetical protein
VLHGVANGAKERLLLCPPKGALLMIGDEGVVILAAEAQVNAFQARDVALYDVILIVAWATLEAAEASRVPANLVPRVNRRETLSHVFCCCLVHSGGLE